MLKALDIFSGAGGSSYGARRAGVSISAAVDLCQVATATFAHNFPETTIINSPLERIRPNILKNKIGEIDILLASPECTNHTCARGSRPISEDSRATAMQVVRFAKAFEPRWIILENVVHMRPWFRYEELKTRFRSLGYQLREMVLDSSDFGVPQKRRRLFIICEKGKQPPPISLPNLPRKLSVLNILDPPGTWKANPLFIDKRAKGTLERAQRAFDALGYKEPFLIVYYGTDGSGGWQRLDRPLRTITTIDRFGLVEPTREGHTIRMLQPSELRRAMGFQDDYEMPAGTRRDKVRLLGNAVCPPVMEAIVRQLTAEVFRVPLDITKSSGNLQKIGVDRPSFVGNSGSIEDGLGIT